MGIGRGPREAVGRAEDEQGIIKQMRIIASGTHTEAISNGEWAELELDVPPETDRLYVFVDDGDGELPPPYLLNVKSANERLVDGTIGVTKQDSTERIRTDLPPIAGPMIVRVSNETGNEETYRVGLVAVSEVK